MATPSWQVLHDLITRDIELSEQCLQLLNEERSALDSRDYTRFQQILSEKQPLLALLEQHSRDRSQQLADLGLTSDADALQTLQQQAPETARQWQQLTTLWQQCQEQNQRNSKAVQRTRLVVDQLLGILRGQQTAAPTYDQQGTTHSGGSGRSIGSA